MKVKEKKKARTLRKKGYSINEIVSKVDASKGSVSVWVRDIELTQKQKERLSKKGHSKEVIEKRRKTRLKNERAKRQRIIKKAEGSIENISDRELFFIGVALYWGEGAKKRNVLHFSNSDPKLIKIMMRFFRNVCGVPIGKMQGHIHLHQHLNVVEAERYWSEVSGIPREQFYKTSQQHNVASKNKKDSLPYGTFSIYVCDTKRALSMKGWMRGVFNDLTR